MRERVIEILKEILTDMLISIDSASATASDTVLIGEGGTLDSLSAARFISAVEQRFNIDIIENDLNLNCMESIDTLADFILPLLSEEELS